MSAIIPPSLNHLVVFNPSIKPSVSVTSTGDAGVERDRDLEDDLAQAAQILFYTSREAGGVSRDRMLRQVGLVKGLMSFTGMLAPDDNSKDGFWAIHANRSRLIVLEPEPEFYIYINIALAHTQAEPNSETRSEPTASAQGIPDRYLVDCLQRGYDDFKLLHGSFGRLMPPSSDTSALLDKFWTRFAFTFESTILTRHPDPLGLRIWLGGYPAPALELSIAVDRAIEVFKEDAGCDSEHVGLIGKDGPLFSQHIDAALLRYLVNLVRLSLPPEPVALVKAAASQTVADRKASWGGWVPSMPSIGLVSRSNTPDPTDPGKIAKQVPAAGNGAKSRWSGLGLGGLGDTLGNVGHVFGRSASKSDGTVPGGKARAEPPEEASSQGSVQDDSEGSSNHQVVQTAVALPELEAAQVDPEAEKPELAWEMRTLWVANEERRLSWLIRDGILVSLLSSDALRIAPTAVLSLFSKIAPLANPDQLPRRSLESRPSSLVNSSVHLGPRGTSISGPEIDATSALSMLELKNILATNADTSEVCARTATSRFVAAKRTAEEELYLLVGRKDASLVDADVAVKAFERAHVSSLSVH